MGGIIVCGVTLMFQTEYKRLVYSDRWEIYGKYRNELTDYIGKYNIEKNSSYIVMQEDPMRTDYLYMLLRYEFASPDIISCSEFAQIPEDREISIYYILRSRTNSFPGVF